MKDWRWLSEKDRESRIGRIFELTALGLNNKQIGQRLGISGQQVGRIRAENKDVGESLAKLEE